MHIRYVLLLFTLGVTGVLNAQSSPQESAKLPPTPEGYSWQWISDQPIAMLVPKGWISYSAGPGISFMEKGNTGVDRTFRTSFTFNLLKYHRDKFETPEGEMTAVENFLKSDPEVDEVSLEIQPAVSVYSSKCYCISYTKDSTDGPVKGRQWLWYYQPMKRIFSCVFECPAESWEKAAPMGQEIIGNIFINVR